MTLLDLLCAPWAIQPERLREMQAIYATHLRGEKIDVKAVEARIGRPLDNKQATYDVKAVEARLGRPVAIANDQKAYDVASGVAILQVQGAISPKANLMTQISGGATAQLLMRDLKAAAGDSGVQSILLSMDTPGGSVQLIPEFGALIAAVAAAKPVVTHSDGALASAGYWLGSAANAVYVSGPGVMVGSIGVVQTHRDVSRAKDAEGITDTEITAGKYKRVASSNGPLTKDGRAEIQAQVDYYYGLFVDAVANHRGTDAASVLEHMADGRIFIGQQAIDAGLVDGMASIEALLEQMATNPASFAARRLAQIKGVGSKKSTSAGAARSDVSSQLPNERPPMSDNQGAAAPAPITIEALKRDHAAVYAAIAEAGATAERERVANVRAQTLPGHEALIEALVADGKTTGPEAAMAVLAAERGLIKAENKAHFDDAPKAAKTVAAPADAQTKLQAQKDAAAGIVAAFNKANGGSHA